jgi:hypothetical protein
MTIIYPLLQPNPTNVFILLEDYTYKNIEIKKGKATWFDKRVCCFLKRLKQNHCDKSLGE